MLERLDRSIWRPLLTVAGVYLLFGLLWISLSDWAVRLIAPSYASIASLQTIKGSAFVLISTALIAGLLAREATRRRSLDHDWRHIIDSAGEGFWMIDASGRTRVVNRRMAASLGYEPDDLVGRTPFEFVIDADRELVERHLGGGSGRPLRDAEPGPLRYEVRARHRDGHSVPFLVQATAMRDERGVVAGSYAFMTDLSEVREHERALQLSRYAIDRAFDEIYRFGQDGRLLDVNQSACRNLGYEREELIGRRIAEIDVNAAAYEWATYWDELERRGALTLETRHRRRDGTDYPVEVAVSHMVYEDETFAYAVARGVQERKAAESSARRAHEALRALSRCNAALVQARDQTDLFIRVCDALASSRGYPLVWVALARDDSDAIEVAAAAGEARAYLEGPHITRPEQPRWQEPSGCAVRSGTVEVVRDIGSARDHAPWRKAARAHGFSACAALPVRVGNRVIGALNVYSADAAAFDQQELPLLEELAADLGFGIRTLDVRAERDRQFARLRLAGTVFDNSAEAIVVTDARMRIETVNRAFTEITGYGAAEAIGHAPPMLRAGLHDRAFFERLWSQVERERVWQGEIWSRRRDGDAHPGWLTLSAVRDEAGSVTNYVGMFSDLTQAHRTQQELTFLAHHDPLTELPNRASFRERLQRALDGAEPRLAVVLADLHGFRALNDSFGDRGGDAVLHEVAGRLRGVLRERDVLARAGGDEFWILVRDGPRHQGIDEWVRQLSAAISEPLTVAGETIRLEASMGVALVPEDGTGVDEVLTNAATALHRAQEKGRGQVDYFQPTMHEAVQQRVRFEEALKTALEKGELRVWYHPQVELATGTIYGAEALARWQHPKRGLLLPSEFIPVAESTGLIGPIGDWVLEQALRRFARWREAGVPVERVSVNASTMQLQRPEWPEIVHAILERTGVPAHCLEIEITEENVLDNLDDALTTMEWLKELDVRLAIDDFGKGYSSLVNVKQFPVDALKIDKSFVDGLPDVEYDRSITEAILGVSRALSLDVIAEGVETEAQAAWLRAHDVRLAQGFLFHRPLSAEQFEALFRSGTQYAK